MQMLQHVWTYKPLVHDVLGMQANSVTIDTKAETGQLPGTTSKKRYEVGRSAYSATAAVCCKTYGLDSSDP